MNGLSSLLNYSWPLKEIPYASALSFELRKSTANNNHYIQVLFKNNDHFSNSSELVPVKLSGKHNF